MSGFAPLDRERILDNLPDTARRTLSSLTVLAEVDSTNRYLMEGEGITAPGAHACVAEAQTAGRGRRGRGWVSPPGGNLYLSIACELGLEVQALLGMSVAMGVAAARALESLDVDGVALKWPNDILLAGRKLGGILVETSRAAGGAWRVVTGVGINVDMPDGAGTEIDQPWTDLASAGAPPERNRLAAALIAEMLAAQAQFAASGLEAFQGDWNRLDALRDRAVELLAGNARRAGVARGVDGQGALLLDVGGRCERVLSGDVSLRPAR